MLRAAAAACAIVATASLQISAGPYFPDSRLAPTPIGLQPPYAMRAQGASVEDGTFVIGKADAPFTAALYAGNGNAVAGSLVDVVPAPSPGTALVAVASYDDGVVLHDADTLHELGTMGIAGHPTSVAFEPDGTLAAADTSGDTLSLISTQNWGVKRIGDVWLADEVLVDPQTGNIFASDRSVDGAGALTRIAPNGKVAHIVTGDTAEGLALDDRRGIVYVGNVNDGTVLAVNARTMRPIRRIATVPRVFGIALSPDGDTLYAVANQSASSQFHAAGYVAAFDLRKSGAPRIARSADLQFPIGVALDQAAHRLFVTDEAGNRVYVLDARTLRAAHAPLATCSIPWNPDLDVDGRLLIPCAGSNRIDVFDARTLRRVAGAPFATGGYPLGISVWRPAPRSER